MKRYRMTFSEDAADELTASLQWGIDNWGEDAAWRWYHSLRNQARQLLSSFPLNQPIAPAAKEYEVEVRHMIVGRYRVLFNVRGETVTILHIRGPYSS
jgi:plasmid stabilization system protein ParE